MKKALFPAVLALLLLTGCGKTAQPLALPPAEEVRSVTVVDSGGAERQMEGREEIAALLDALSSAVPTRIPSVNDAPPDGTAYDTIRIRAEGGDILLYAYEKRGNHCLEQPYQGVYRLPLPLGTDGS